MAFFFKDFHRKIKDPKKRFLASVMNLEHSDTAMDILNGLLEPKRALRAAAFSECKDVMVAHGKLMAVENYLGTFLQEACLQAMLVHKHVWTVKKGLSRVANPSGNDVDIMAMRHPENVNYIFFLTVNTSTKNGPGKAKIVETFQKQLKADPYLKGVCGYYAGKSSLTVAPNGLISAVQNELWKILVGNDDAQEFGELIYEYVHNFAEPIARAIHAS